MKNHRTIRFVLFTVFSALVILTLQTCGGGGGSSTSGGGGNGGGEVIGDSIKLTRVIVGGVATVNGYLTIPFIRNDERKFINIVVDLNNDGRWESYSVNGKTQAEWLVQNMLAKISPAEPNSFSFVLNDIAADDRKNLKARVILTNAPLDTSNYPTGWDGTVPNSVVAQKDFKISEIDIDAGDLFSPESGGLGSGGSFNSSTPKSLISSSKATDTDVPDLTQGRNGCVPTSTANALLWLAKVHGFENKMPATEALISELEADFKWDIESGVDVPSDFLSGKQKFVERHGLPISTVQVGAAYDPEIIDKISEELTNGGIVEIDMAFKNASGQRVGGHMVTVVDVIDKDGVKYMDIHDPASPTFIDMYRINSTQVVDYRYQGSTVTYIRLAFAEAQAECPNIAGNWNFTDSGTVTCSGGGDTETIPISGSGTANITQNGCNVSWPIPLNGVNYSRSGTVSGNAIQVSGVFVVPLVGEVNITQNTYSASGTISEDTRTMTLNGLGLASGSYEGIAFSCSGTDKATFTRSSLSSASLSIYPQEFKKRQPKLFLNNSLEILTIGD